MSEKESSKAEQPQNTAPSKMEEAVSAGAARVRAAQEAAHANTVACSNTKLVACMDSLGFPSDCQPAQHVTTDKIVREFIIQPRSIDPAFRHLSIQILREYESGRLEDAMPMHPLCIAMRTMHNYDRLQDMQKQGVVMNLRATALIDPKKPEMGGRMTIYKRCPQPDPRCNFSPETVEKTNLMLVAALAGVGIPVLSYAGLDGARSYCLPRFGYTLLRDKEHGEFEQYLEDAASPLYELAGIPQDPFALAICETDPLHPVAIGYNALRSRIRLRDLLNEKAPRLLIQDGSMQAMVTAEYKGRVMEQLHKRFGLPTI